MNEFENAKKEFFDAIGDLINDPIYVANDIYNKLITPDRIIEFDVEWVNDKNEKCLNKGYRVQFNNLCGPYKGGLRFHPSVNLNIFKFLAFEQVFKNSLTGLPMGGAKGGSDFNPKGKSKNEIKNFCYAFMDKLYPYIGEDLDIPAGDIGVGEYEIRCLYERYVEVTGKHDCSLTGKPISLCGSLCRKEATGYGLCYFVDAMLKYYLDDTFENKKVIISGSGNVAIYAAEKVNQLGGIVIAMSDSNNTIYNENGLDISIVKMIKEEQKGRIKEYLKYKDASLFESSKDIWGIKCDIALPCATQLEIDLSDAQKLVNNGVKIVAEGANMPTSIEATDLLIKNGVLFAPGKASNAGGVSVSGLEITQNKTKEHWSFEKVDCELKRIMNDIFNNLFKTAQENNDPYNLMKAANIYSFKKISNLFIKKDIKN